MNYLTGRFLTETEINREKEFGEPFGQILRGFAEQGCTLPFTAKAMGMQPAELRRRMPLHDPNGEIQWPDRNSGSAA